MPLAEKRGGAFPRLPKSGPTKAETFAAPAAAEPSDKKEGKGGPKEEEKKEEKGVTEEEAAEGLSPSSGEVKVP